MGFKKDFVWGAASASYQVEGAAYEDGKGRNIWDEFSHIEGKIADRSSGDVACDHYHRFRDDVKMMSELGLKAYRFSISWARIFPDGYGKINQAGIDFYNALIDELLKYGIEPYVTAYHWDLPYALHLQGGWLNDDISDHFAEYVRVLCENFGDRVKNFITFNEPQVFVGCGYFLGDHAPGYKLSAKELLHLGHNILLAHGKAVRVIRSLVPDAKIGVASATRPHCPVSADDRNAAYNSYFGCGKNHFVFAEAYWFDPIVFGRYPDSILNECRDILPEFTDEDMKLIGSGIDFIGLNIYTGNYTKANKDGISEMTGVPAGHPRTAIGWDIIPESLYWGPTFYHERYKLPIFITENGMAAHDCISLDGKVHDPNRTDYLNRYLRELRRASEDGAEINGYFQWSVMDNYEWAQGYSQRFGMVYVDYTTQERVIKDSAIWYRSVIGSNGENL